MIKTFKMFHNHNFLMFRICIYLASPLYTNSLSFLKTIPQYCRIKTDWEDSLSFSPCMIISWYFLKHLFYARHTVKGFNSFTHPNEVGWFYHGQFPNEKLRVRGYMNSPVTENFKVTASWLEPKSLQRKKPLF